MIQCLDQFEILKSRERRCFLTCKHYMHLSNFFFFSLVFCYKVLKSFCLALNSCCLFLKGMESRELSLRVFLVLSFQNRKVRYEMVSCQTFEVIVLGWPENGLQITMAPPLFQVTNFLNFQVNHVMRSKIIFNLECLTSKFI